MSYRDRHRVRQGKQLLELVRSIATTSVPESVSVAWLRIGNVKLVY